MYLAACGGLLLAGLALNLRDRRMFALTLLVGASVFLPVPSHSAIAFYGSCIAAEIVVILLAVRLDAKASLLMVELCTALVVTHLMGYALDGSPPFSPYRAIVKLLEVSQLVACLALSPVLATFLRNHDASPT